MKQLAKVLLVVYILFLLWLILFKTSTDIVSVLLHFQSRILNLIPFGDEPSKREMLDNVIVFIPLGLLLSANYKTTSLRRKLALVFGFSLAMEVLQYALAIGRADITDVIMNTLGGWLGLALYGLAGKRVDEKKLDGFILITGAIVLLLFLWARFMIFRVRY